MEAAQLTETPKDTAAGKLTGQQRNVLLVVFSMLLINSFTGSALNLSITDMSSDLASGATTITWVVSIFTLVTAVLSIPLGHLGDIADRRRIFMVGTAVFGVTSLLCAFSTSAYLLIALRAVQGAGSAAVLAVGIPLLLSVSPPNQRGRMLGLSVTAVYLGLSLGPVLGGSMNLYLGWRSIFVLTFIVPVVVFVGAIRFLPAEPQKKGASGDPAGNALSVLMFALLLLGLSLISYGAWAWALVAASLVVLPLFVRHELRCDHPVVQVSLFASDAAYSLSNLAALLNYGATFAISYCLSLYLQNVLGLPTAIAGIVLIAQPVVQTVISPFAGRLSDRVAPYKLASAGMAVIACGLFLMSRLDAASPLPLVVAELALVGLGFGFFSSPNNNAVLSCVDRRHIGEANAILSTMRTLGMSVSMVIIMFIISLFVGDSVIAQADTASLMGALQTAMVVYGCICVVGVVISLVRSKAQ